MEKLERIFYAGNCLDVAKNILGKLLVHRYNEIELIGRIVEVEAYIGAIDKAAHSYNHRRTRRTEVMFGPPGFVYVYLIYGMYYCMNVVTSQEGEASAILLRGIEPIKGIEQMAMNRYGKSLENLKKSEIINLTNGPGKLCKAMGITMENYGEDLLGDRIFIAKDLEQKPFEIKTSKRVNIDYAEEAKDFEWRFSIQGNSYVSKGK